MGDFVTPPILRLTIDVPGFYVDGTEDAETIEILMQLVTEQVAVTFAHTEGDGLQVFVKPMEGHIVKYEIYRG